jgi:hypothetical protein
MMPGVLARASAVAALVPVLSRSLEKALVLVKELVTVAETADGIRESAIRAVRLIGHSRQVHLRRTDKQGNLAAQTWMALNDCVAAGEEPAVVVARTRRFQLCVTFWPPLARPTR